MKKIINCASCDTRKVTEESLAAFEKITINAASVLVSPESKLLLNRYGVDIQCSDIIELPADTLIRTVNGVAAITSTDAEGPTTALLVNGLLDIAPGTQEALKRYISIQVNGVVRYPTSLEGCMPMLELNGSAACYPDDAVILKNNSSIDRVFLLRAKNRLYWSQNRLICTDMTLDMAALKSKGVRFAAQTMLIAESLMEDMVELVDDHCDIVPMPDGTKVFTDDVTLNANFLEKNGNKLYVLGNVIVPEKGVLESVAYLHIVGSITVNKDEKGMAELKAEAEEGVKVFQAKAGRVIADRDDTVEVTAWMLEQGTLRIEDCNMVWIDPTILAERILDLLIIRDCASVHCSPEQKGAVTLICEDVEKIITEGSASEKKEEKIPLSDPDTMVINAADCVL